MATIKQIKDTEGNIHDILSTIGYGTCATAAATAAKVATIDDTSWTLKVGSVIGIKFTNTNTAGSTTTPVTLNVNSTGAKNIYYNNAKYTSTSSNICGFANRVIYYMYDGTYWVWMNNGTLDGNIVPSIQIETSGSTAAKTGTCTNYSLLTNSYAHVNVRYANSSKSALTLNVNSKGAKPIYINGTASSASNYTLPAGTYIIYYDGTNYHFRTDGVIPGKILNANHATTAEYAESCERAIISDLAIGDENGNNIISTYVTRSDFGSLTDNVNRIESDFTGFTVFAEETFSKTMLSVTHSQLVNLRDNCKLIPGQQYRITDYITTTVQEDTESAGHQFDIIVTANSNNTLSEIASACLHEGDTYFSENGANLSAWQIWYCLDNDTNRFSWVDNSSRIGEEQFVAIYWDDPVDGENYDDKIGDDEIYEWGIEYDPELEEDNIVIYKSEESIYIEEGSVDYGDKYFYRGVITVDGIEYDRWKKWDINCEGWCYLDGRGQQYALTKRIVFDNKVVWSNKKYDSSNCVIKGEFDAGSDGSGYYALSEYVYPQSIMMNDPVNGDPYEFLGKDMFGHYGYEKEPNGSNSLFLLGYLFDFNEETGEINIEGLNDNERYYYRGIITVDGEEYDCWQKWEMNKGYSIENTYYYYLTNRIVDGEIISVEEESTKGVIYRMIDEWGNDCPYDFKNIMFKRWLYADCGGVTDEENGDFESYCYTFSWEESNGDIIDASIFGNNGHLLNDENQITGVYGNIMGVYMSYDGYVNNPKSTKQYLNNNVFFSTCGFDCGYYYGCYSNTFGNGCGSNTFGNSCHSNKFVDDCRDNTFGDYFVNNTFGHECYGNTFDTNCYGNTFGNECVSNTFGNSCYSNTFGNSCHNNTIGNVCYNNTFGNGCFNNTFGNGCGSNTFGNSCHSNKFVDDCRDNTFGDGCYHNKFSNECNSNTFGDGCDYNTFGDGCYHNKFSNECNSNTFGNNCNYNTFGNNCISNIFGTVNSNNELVTNAGSCSRNTFGTNCYNNKLFNSCQNNSFDIDCHDNEFGTSCTYNKFDTLCAVIKFGNGCSYNTLGNGCTNIKFGTSSTLRSYYRRIIIDNGNQYIYLNCTKSIGSSKYYQNVRIGLGVNNTSTYKTITYDGDINQTFETYYKPSESQTILI